MRKKVLKAGDKIFIVSEEKGFFQAVIKDIEYDLDKNDNEIVHVHAVVKERKDAKSNT